MKFKEINLNETIINNITNMGYEEMTPIQEKTMPIILDNKDVLGLAETGTGKTAAFALPLLEKLIDNYQRDGKIKLLILCPTRELAIQTRDNINKYSENTGFRCGAILGGVNIESQKKVLKRGIDILVATPGRLVDLIDQRKADISNVSMLVLDEADTMLDMGFIHDIKLIINKTNKNRQTLLFSATMNNDILNISKEFMHNPITVNIESNKLTVDKVTQEVYFVDKNNKTNLLLDLISTEDKPSTLIFTRTKHGANKLEDELKEFDITASVIHGNKTQSNRVKALQDFKSGKNRIMIATDIAARGLDINDLGLVVNYDMPEQPEVYVHRIGRTARAGKEGRAISLCSSAETDILNAVEKLIHQSIKEIEHKYPMVLKEDKPIRGRMNRTNNSNKSTKNNDRPTRNNRLGRSERPARDSKPRFSKDNGRDNRFGRSERPARDSKPRFNKDNGRDNKFGRSERPARDSKPRFNKDNGRDNKFGRSERPTRDSKPRFSKDNVRDNKFGRSERPARDSKLRFNKDSRRSNRELYTDGKPKKLDYKGRPVVKKNNNRRFGSRKQNRNYSR